MASIGDVAKRAGVGRATVSRVINNNGYVAEDTRKRVVAAMEELNYTPNELARNLFRKRTGIVAVLVPTISHPFFGYFVENVEVELYKRGYKTMICCANYSEAEEKEYLDMLNRHIVDGIISGVHSLDTEEYQRIKGPIVALDRYLGENIPVVSVNHAEGGRLAAEELIRSGCRNVLHFRGGEQIEAPFHKRHQEFERIMAENGVNTYVYDMTRLGFHRDEVCKAMDDLLSQGIKLDGIFGVDMDAIAGLNECVKRNLRVPEDVKIIAYDGTYIAQMTSPELTCVVQPIEQIAKDVVHHITNMIDGRVYVDRSINRDVVIKKGETTL